MTKAKCISDVRYSKIRLRLRSGFQISISFSILSNKVKAKFTQTLVMIYESVYCLSTQGTG